MFVNETALSHLQVRKGWQQGRQGQCPGRRNNQPGRCGDLAAIAIVALLVNFFGVQMLRIFNTDPAVAKYGMIRLRYIVTAHLFSVFVETISGAMRGYGFSAYPALMSLFGICGIRIFWVYTVFSRNPVFDVLMMVYPVSIGVTAAAIAAVYFRVTRTKLKEVRSA